MEYNRTCPPLDDENYLLNPTFGDGCCTMGTILAFSVPPALSFSLCVGVYYCFRQRSSKWRCTITPGLFLVWVCCLISCLCIFFSTGFDGISVHTRYLETTAIVCDIKWEGYECNRGDTLTCYRLWIWLAYFRDNELVYALDRGFIYTNEAIIVAKVDFLNLTESLTIWYDPLLANVISIENEWTSGTQLGLLATTLTCFGLVITSLLMFYFELWPWIRQTPQQSPDLELVGM